MVVTSLKLTEFQRACRPAEQSFFLFGPRGTGKSTWLRQILPEAHRIDLLDQGHYQDFLRDPGLLANELRNLAPQTWVILDEIQRIPSLLNDVHQFIESRALRFVLCGSSARKLRQSGTNLLAGRAVRRSMHVFTPDELGAHFDLDSALEIGTLPVVCMAPNPRDTLEAYVQMYLREEIQAEAIVRNLPGFIRFLPIAALMHGQVINVASLARDAGVARTTVDGYLEILEDTLVAWRLPAYEARLRVRERKHPKLYWIDAGLARAARRHLGPIGHDEQGALFEGWLAAVLRANDAYHSVYDELFYWAPAEAKSVEVDFLLRRGNSFLAIEAKNATRLDTTDFRGLRAIAAMSGVERRIVVYRGERRGLTDDGIELWPAVEFALALAEGRI